MLLVIEINIYLLILTSVLILFLFLFILRSISTGIENPLDKHINETNKLKKLRDKRLEEEKLRTEIVGERMKITEELKTEERPVEEEVKAEDIPSEEEPKTDKKSRGKGIYIDFRKKRK